MNIYVKKSMTLILALIFCASFLYAEGLEKGKNQSVKKVTAGGPHNTYLNINNVSTVMRDNGDSDLGLDGNAGFVYPKGSGKTVFYESGPIWGASVNGRYTIGGSAYKHGLQAGRILASGAGADPEGTDPSSRIWRVRSDYKSFTDQSSEETLFASEMSSEGLTAAQVYAEYDADWQNWPAAYGAPFIDKNANGTYEPAIDIPGVSEEPCQTIWWCANDLNTALVSGLYGGFPMHVEIQATMFGFKTTGALGNTIFRKYKMINKNSVKFDSTYFCMWSDPDLGDGSDDFAGCDTALSLGFVYNGQAKDASYQDTPPASGFDFFQGPKIPGLPTDSAKYNNKYLHGYKGLGMTSFFYFSQNVEADFSDPTQNSSAGILQWRNMFEGKKSRSGLPYTSPLTGKATKFPLSGDPVTHSGWVDGILHSRNDRRFGQVSGPFTMNAGDTQEIVVGQLAAGYTPGVGYIASVAVLKFYDKIAQDAYDANFNVATPPPPPIVKVTELDKSIILNWGDLTSYQPSESYAKFGYIFEGYNVYQLPSPSSTIANATRIATFDIKDGVSGIVSQTVDPTSGFQISIVGAYGNDQGIQRYIRITEDKIKQITTLYPGSRYYFAVTAYAYNPNVIQNVLESSLQIITVTPQSTEPGVRLPFAVGDGVAIAHSTGTFTGIGTFGTVVDPKKADGKTYSIIINKNANTGAFTWSLLNGTTVVFADQAIAQDSATAATVTSDPIAGGVQFHVYGSGKTPVSFDATKGSNPYKTDGSVNAYFGFGGELWGGDFCLGQHWYSGTTLPLKGVNMTPYHPITMKFATTTNTGAFSATDPNASMGYRYLRAASSAPGKPSFVPFIKENVTNYGFQEFGLNGGPNIPCAVYDNTTGKRLGLGFLENNSASGTVDGIYFPPSSGNNSGPREFLLILSTDYSTTPNPALAKFGQAVYQNGSYDIMYFITAPRSKDTWTSADELTLVYGEITSTSDKWSVTLPTVTTSNDLATEDVNKVNVFPNPYYGVNKQEINKYQRFVTFTHLPQRANIKIYNVSGQLVRTMTKDATGQFLRWDLATDSGLPVASGIYVAYIDMPDQGVVKKLKMAVIQEQQFMDRF